MIHNGSHNRDPIYVWGKKIIYNSQKIRNSNNNLRIVFLLAKWDLTQVQKGRSKIEKITWDIKNTDQTNTDAFLTSFRGQDLTVVGVIND